MFHNLIESSSHRQEIKRRGSFLLFTTATYAFLFAITGVVSIYAYDTHLEQRNYEVVTMLPPVELIQTTPEVSQPAGPRNPGNNNRATVPERQIAMLNVNRPEVIPVGVAVTPNKNLSLPPSGPFKVSNRDLGDGWPGGGGTGNSKGGGNGTQPPQLVQIVDPPPAPEKPKATPKTISKGVITGLALALPKPNYPPIAKKLGIQGTVAVQVLIDETGQVVSAKAISGSSFLTGEAQKAAYQARFSPTRLSDQPVKVSGVITYKFALDQ
ncbi:MAG TPA: energy transducer TonB [Pyrinomonadaceae bacterium]|nr:energy transducer TonB [Pyrinomonadaceae bacterium]